MAWRIKDWDRLYENSESRKLLKLGWVKVPNKHDGKGYRRLIAMSNGPALFGIWNLVLQVASKSPVRGMLVDEDGPLTTEDIADKTGAPADLVADAIAVFLSERIGWMEECEYEKPDESRNLPEPREKSVRDKTEQKRSEANRSEGISTNGTAAADVTQVRTWLLDYAAAFRLNIGQPDDTICRRVIAACNGRPLTDLQELLIAKCEAGQRPRKSWAWFETVVEANFGTSR